MALSVESLMLEVGKAFAPLEQRLRGDEIPLLFAEIGLPAPGVVLAAQSVRNAVEGAATALSGLPRSLSDLAAAIEAEDVDRIAESVAAISKLVTTVADAVGVVAGAIRAAAAAAGPNRAEVEAFAGELPERLFGFALITYLQDRKPIVANVLELIGVLESTPIAATPAAPTHVRRVLRLDRLSGFLRDPVGTLTELYRWGGPDFDWDLLLQRLSIFLTTVSHFAFPQPGPPPFLRVAGVDIGRTDDQIPGVAATLRLDAKDHLELIVPVNDSVALVATADAAMEAGAAVELLPPADLRVVPPTGEVRGSVRFGVQAPPAAGGPPLVVLGTAGSSRVEARSLRITGGADLDWNAAAGRAEGELVLEAAVEGGKIVLNLADADGFLGTILPFGSIELDADVGLSWSSATGLRFRGTGGVEADIPVDLQVGPVEIRSLHLGLRLTDDGVALEASGTVGAQLGPIAAVADRMGAVIKLSRQDGALDLDVGFKPPTGVGLKISANGASGGGFLSFDPGRGEYAGALELEIVDLIAVKGIGLITTRQPDGSPGFSLLIVLTAEFPSGIQLGAGFTLLAVGGLLGLNRRMDLQALIEGVRTGAIESVAFPKDVVANAPRILSDLGRFFPAQQGTFLIGPMAKIGWGTPPLITASVDLIIEQPGNIAILGVVRAALPSPEDPLLLLQAQFLGALERDKGRLWFFAKLVESRIVGMTVEGGMGLLVAWSGDRELIVTVGGFHPGFNPPPLPFPTPSRLAVDLLNRGKQLIRVTGYFALTPNTVQFGGGVEVRLGFSSFGVEGHLTLDGLINRDPFRYKAHSSGHVSLKAFGVGVFSLSLDLTLEGPAPWRVHGRGSIGFLFFSISADFDFSFGEELALFVPTVLGLPLLVSEIAKNESWETRLPGGGVRTLVSLRSLPAGDDLVLHPLGTLVVRQRALPLGVRVDQIGGQPITDGRRFSLTTPDNGGFVEKSVTGEKFAMAQFQKMSDAAKLSRPSFETQDAGLELTSDQGDLATARVVRRAVRFELHLIDSAAAQPAGVALAAAAGAPVQRFHSVSEPVFDELLRGSSTSRSGLSARQARQRQPFLAEDTVRIDEQRFVVAYVKSNRQAFPPSRSGTTSRRVPSTFRSRATAEDALDGFVTLDPNLAGQLHVIPAAEAAVTPGVPGTWSPAGVLPAPVSEVDLVPLQNGRVLIAGGSAPDGSPVPVTQLFDPAGDSWSTGSALGAARRRHATTRLQDGRVLVTGGQGRGHAPLASAELFDSAAGRWTPAAGMAVARHGHSATVLGDGRVLVAGGSGARDGQEDGALASAELYDPATATWTTTGTLSSARTGHQAVLLDDGRVLVTGGLLPTGAGRAEPLAYCEVFDPADGEWSTTGSLGTARAGHQAVLLADHRVLVTGGDPVVAADGTLDPHSLASAELYDPLGEVWSPARPMPDGGRSGHRSILLRSGEVLVTGGTGAPERSAGFRSVISYDPRSGTWRTLGGLLLGRSAHAVAELPDDRVLAAAGVAGTDPTGTGEVLIP
ncbi:DUF6603 domain-containing protein [Nonomuraea sp. CA-143628]|uniref:DUF6603 domain-containing protein n=1 Tax=Nonomuraea sp. CA-143628 TaxID=3239997 RepID=UPI003D8E47E8